MKTLNRNRSFNLNCNHYIKCFCNPECSQHKILTKLKKVKQEKESLIVQLSESHVLINSLKSESTMLLNTIDALDNK
jgi:hypothetical protein